MRDVGSVVELILNAHRRIRVLEPIIENDAPHISKINGRRTGQQSKKSLILNELNKKRKEKDEKTTMSEEANVTLENLKITYVKTENIVTDPLEKTLEIKVKLYIKFIIEF